MRQLQGDEESLLLRCNVAESGFKRPLGQLDWNFGFTTCLS
jgi:hypothetical protein